MSPPALVVEKAPTGVPRRGSGKHRNMAEFSAKIQAVAKIASAPAAPDSDQAAFDPHRRRLTARMVQGDWNLSSLRDIIWRK